MKIRYPMSVVLLMVASLTLSRGAKNAPLSLTTSASRASTVKTIKVLQYNVKQGKSGQTCCWRDSGIQAKEQAVIRNEMTQQGVELATLIESDDQSATGVWDCSSLNTLLGQTVASLDTQCTVCSTGKSAKGFREALHLVWDTKKWTAIKRYNNPDTCFGNSKGSFGGRAFAAVLLQNVQDTTNEVVFIGVHPGHSGSGQDFKDGAGPIWAAYKSLINGRTNNPKLIISGDFNLGCGDAVDQINAGNVVSIDKSSQCPSPRSCCCDSNFLNDFDHVFTNLPGSQVTTAIASSYGGPFTPGGCSQRPHDSEEHKPVVGTIQYN
jgi:hypothetical protein